MKNNATINCLTLGGGLVAVLLCASACGPANPPYDSGIPGPDSGPPTDGGMDLPDSYVPPDTDGGMPDLDSGPIEVDSGTDGGMASACTAEMLANRVSPPCDPDNNPEFGPGVGPTGMESVVDNVHTWFSTGGGGFGPGMETDSMGRIGSGPWGPASGVAPYNGLFYYSADGDWYANWANRHLPGTSGNHARIHFSDDHTGTLYQYLGGSDVAAPPVPLWR